MLLKNNLAARLSWWVQWWQQGAMSGLRWWQCEQIAMLQYSSANMMVSMRAVTVGSAGFGECMLRSKS